MKKRAIDTINVDLARIETFLSVVCEGRFKDDPGKEALAKATADCDRIRDQLRIIRNAVDGI